MTGLQGLSLPTDQISESSEQLRSRAASKLSVAAHESPQRAGKPRPMDHRRALHNCPPAPNCGGQYDHAMQSRIRYWSFQPAFAAESFRPLSPKLLQRRRQARDFRVVRPARRACARLAPRVSRPEPADPIAAAADRRESDAGLCQGGARVLRSIKRIQRDDIDIGEARFLGRQFRRATKFGHSCATAGGTTRSPAYLARARLYARGRKNHPAS